MGTIKKGILGGFSGTVGTVVGGSWKGIDYMRSKTARRTKSFSAKQLDQQVRFALVVKFLQPLTGLLALSFQDFAVKMSGFNNALRYTLKNAVTGTYPDYTVDPSLVLVTRGDLPNALSPAAASATAGQLNFTWKDNAGVGQAAATDKALLVAYAPDRNQVVYTILGAARSAQADTLAVPGFSGLKVDSYISFLADDGSIASSLYTGQITIL